ncbi:MAG TPA: hypothetical protein VJV79_18265 [Polyangiaceae bacterium]|nr:hypothetical protein [Polyangiaceae bacterium]
MTYRGLLCAAGVLAFGVACGPDSGAAGRAQSMPDGSAGSAGSGTWSGVSDGGRGTVIDTSNSSAGAPNSGTTCAKASATATLSKQPVDVILVLDNSGSMEDELDAVEKNINVNFANILQQSGVDYRVILISRHRKEARTESEEASTSICVSSPLSDLAECPASKPVNSDRFFQYSIKVESENSFDRILSTYNKQDQFDLTKAGWAEWLRPGAKKVFLEMTDDNAALSVEAFVQRLTALVPANFGTEDDPSFIFHSIIGIREKSPSSSPYAPDEPIELSTCSEGGSTVANAGVGYQELSRRTGGLRFPICAFSSYDTVFSTIASDVVTHSQLTCDFDIPTPPDGQTLDLSRVAVAVVRGGATTPAEFAQALTSADCQADAFYIENNHIYLCPETCSAVKADGAAKVDVLFTCESTIIVK